MPGPPVAALSGTSRRLGSRSPRVGRRPSGHPLRRQTRAAGKGSGASGGGRGAGGLRRSGTRPGGRGSGSGPSTPRRRRPPRTTPPP
ncbi:hypothetical protein MUK42_19644 [Musa troglodytarum]|uniref:Uncharacterized protein n=1 Tax=Musa troglodytarum TaxID=320322 RepID=A0A9E7G257_9LILI|nr:hypothetical protein MUK42_19644 [Musa troglodytarum]